MSNRGHRAWIWYLVMVWERFGAGGKQHNRSGAVLASTGGTGRGRLPVPSPASTSTNYTNSTARAPAAEAKGPGGRGACGEPRGAWCRRLGRRGEAFRGRVRELGKQHSPKLTTTRIAFIVSLRLHRRKTTRNRRGAPQPQQRAHFFAHPPTRFSLGSGVDWSGGQAAWQQRGSAGLGMGHGARATPARSLPRSSY